MSIKLISSYSKKLGLPAYSSHSFAASVETEIVDLAQAQEEIARLYRLLQEAVDREIRHPGFIPQGDYFVANENGNGHQNGSRRRAPAAVNREADGQGVAWACTDKQRQLILQLIREQNLEMNRIQELAYERFGLGLRQLRPAQASDLITELLHGHDGHHASRANSRP